jgi:hypothetical protein
LRKRSRILNRDAAVAIYAIAISQSKRIDFESRVYCGSVRGGCFADLNLSAMDVR